MKKIICLSLIALVIFPSLASAQTKTKIEEEISIIADVAPDPTIVYPWPFYKIRVISPDGGEIWYRSEVHTISWSFSILSSEGGTEIKCEECFRPKASIDLYERVLIVGECEESEIYPEPIEKSVFVKHIADVNPFDLSYSWKIQDDIPNGKKERRYVIRITIFAFEGVRYPIGLKEETNGNSAEKPIIYPYRIWDESDGTFTITGEQPPTPDNVQEAIRLLLEIMEQLRKAIAFLQSSL